MSGNEKKAKLEKKILEEIKKNGYLETGIFPENPDRNLFLALEKNGILAKRKDITNAINSLLSRNLIKCVITNFAYSEKAELRFIAR